MNSLFKILTVCLLLITSIGLKAQEKRTITSVLLNVSDSTPIAYAHIVNLSSKTGTSSNILGGFTITVAKNDSLIISEIGFESLMIYESSIETIIYLKEKNYPLEEFSVLPYRNYSEFKEAFVELELTDDKPKMNYSFKLSLNELRSYDGSRGFGGAISGIFAKFNKHMKDKKHVEQLVKQDEYVAFLATKFNPIMVKKITKIENNQTLQDFIKYCDFSNQFIAKASKYDLITQIFECHEEYNSLPMASK